MSEQPFLDRLASLRRRIRLLLVLDGIGLVLAGGMCAVIVAAILDYLMWLPASARLVAGVGFCVGLTMTAWLRVLRPLVTRIEVGQVAAALDARFAELEDRLASAADFVRAPGRISPSMARRVVAQANEAAARLPLGSVIRWRRPAMMIVVALAVGTALAGVAMAAPWFVRTGLRRYADPFGAAQWPRRVLIEPASGNVRRPEGGWFEARARILRGQSDSLRVFACTEAPGGRIERHAMTFEAKNGQYFHVFKDLRGDFIYWFEAGDDSTLDRGGRFDVTVVPRPAVLLAQIELTDPPYVDSPQPRTMVIQDAPVSAVAGSGARLTIQTNKPIVQDPKGPARVELSLPNGERLMMKPSDETDRRFVASFEMRRSGPLSVLLVDENGFDNRGGTTYALSVRQDEPPRVVIVEPQALAEVTPTARLDVVVSADDDFRITELSVEAVVDRRQEDRPTTYDLTKGMQSRRASGRWMSTANWPWDLAPMSLKPGDLVTYRAVARDNFALAGDRHPPVRSAEMRLKVISPDQLAERVRDELMLLKGALRQMLAGQQTARDDAEVLKDQAEAGRELSRQARETLMSLASEQTRLATRSRYLSKRFGSLVERLDANRSKEDDVRKRSAEASKRLNDLAAGPISEAAGRLQEAGQAEAPKDQARALGSATREQLNAAEQLRSLLASMDQWGDFQDVVRHVQQLLDEQERQTQSTQRLGQQTLGRRVSDLPPKLAGELKQQSHEQRRLAEDLGRLKENMAQMAEGIRRSDAAASAALDAARQIADGQRLVARMSSVADDIAENRIAQAQKNQRATEDGLREMLVRLQQRGMQQLAELNKRLQQATERLESLIADQKALQNETRELKATDDATRRNQLADRQRGLGRTAKAIAEAVAKVDRGERPARDIGQAGKSMSRAADDINKGQKEQADARQTEAIQQLAQSLERLRKLRAQAEAEMAAKTLGAIADEIKALRDRQAGVNERLGELTATRAKGEALSRVQLRHLDKLAGQERELAGGVSTLRTRIQTAHVYDWVMTKIAADMRELAKRFDGRRVGGETTRLADYVLRRMDQLLAGLQQKPPDDLEKDPFADEGGGGGQGGKGTKDKPVPTVAELLVLKELQSELNRRTTEADLEGQLSENVTEQHLEKVRQLGLEQEQIRRLAEQIVRQARQR